MQDLVGMKFSVEQQTYAITDIRKVGSETMVYASAVGERAGPGRASFRLEDIQQRLKMQQKSA